MTPEERDQQLDALITIAAKNTARIEALAGVAEKPTWRHDDIDARLEALITAAEQHCARSAEVDARLKALLAAMPRH
jgi:hypothetical protein